MTGTRWPSLSVMFFGDGGGHRYVTVREVAVLADRLGYEALWLPERHFDAFGGRFPNPSVLAAAVAVLTTRCHVRAGSVVAPLHDVLRIAEEWSVVENLAGPGRVGVSIGSGWNTNDFVLAPDRYADRRERSLALVDELRALWSGEAATRVNGSGQPVAVTIHPRPLTPHLPVWLTSSGNAETFEAAGRLGTNVLTHLLGHDLAELARKIKLYREARAGAGHEGPGRVTLMLHTAVVDGDADAAALVTSGPLRDYLRSALRLELRASAGGGAVSGGRRIALPPLPEALVDELVEERARRFRADASLIGRPAECARMLDQVADAGVDEVACLIDFGPSDTAIRDTLTRLADLAGPAAAGPAAGAH